MLIIDSPSHDAYFNIASEEFLLNKYPKEEIFLLYVNAPSIIVGKYQNTLAEINLDFVKANNIKVVRRMSGGGAVYHDLGNLNFSFHSPSTGKDFTDFTKFTAPIIAMLNELGVPAALKGRNDLLVNDKKFSGNAKLVKGGKVIQHGTILLDSEMSILADALKVNPLKFKDKAIKSTRARVTNLKPFLPEDMSNEDFKKSLISYMLKTNPGAEIHTLSQDEIRGIQHLADEKYSTWNWNFGFSPAYNFSKADKFPAGFIEVHLDVVKGVIEKAKVFGDFFASKPIEDFEAQLIGKKHDIESLKFVFEQMNLVDYFGKVTLDEIVELFK